MKTLGLAAEVVPVVYRLRAFTGSTPIGEHTHTCLPGDIDAAAARVVAALQAIDVADVSVDYWQA